MIQRLVGLHTHVGAQGWRLLQLHLLWMLYTLRGGVLLGVFPATAAVHDALRADLMSDDGAERSGLRARFGQTWRRSFRRANTLGYVYTALWAVLFFEHRLLDGAGGSGLGSAAAGLLWFAMAHLFMVGALVWMLDAHFAESVPALLRRASTLVLGRPLVGLGATAAFAAVLCLYYLVPGLIAVFGVTGPALATSVFLWHSGVLPRTGPTLSEEKEVPA